MGKHGKGMGKYIRGNLDDKVDLGTLAAKTLISSDVGGSVQERTRVTSMEATWSLNEFTVAVGDGPIIVGVANSDYTDSEIEEVLEQDGSWTEGNLTAQEISKRKIRIIGSFRAIDISAGNFVLNNGLPIKTKLNWILITGQTLSLWAYNAGESALATTDPDLHVYGHVNLFPQ